jgi:arylsulfatase A-like enzyme
MWTPLVVKLPGQTNGAVDDRAAETIDIVPTIADELGVDVPWNMDGRSLLGEPRADGPRRLADWALNQVRPEDGKDYVEFDGPAGFAALLKTAATRATGDPALRLYRIGGYGGLIGRPAAPLVAEGGRRPAATVENADQYRDVRKDGHLIPWAYAHGTVAVRGRSWVAVVVNGTVAAVSQTLPGGSSGESEYAAVLPPKLVRPGHNDVQVFVVSGPVGAPQLQPTRLER